MARMKIWSKETFRYNDVRNKGTVNEDLTSFLNASPGLRVSVCTQHIHFFEITLVADMV